ncbi:MAG TPA: PIN domain-containing protein [Verrucomicrobiales bacterium]|jgi:predicted nucleic acid-binding protein|nr:PIN domain-containing protein [Verrucomicrobiales bacterium]
MRTLIDTNVLLDVFLARAGAQASGKAILASCRAPHVALISWHTLANCYYIMRRGRLSHTGTIACLRRLLRWAEVAVTGSATALRAMDLPMADFEDALQAASAEAEHADVIMTRNTADFVASPVPVLTPEDYLASYRLPNPLP